MNIFILSHQTNPIMHHVENASYHCDKHVVKMIAESTQMLVTALPYMLKESSGFLDNTPCKPLSAGHAKHPCTLWTCADIRNFNYLSMLAWSLCVEHQYRYPLSPEHAYLPWLRDLAAFMHDQGLGPACKMPDNYAMAIKDVDQRAGDLETVVAEYRAYYVRDKARFATWKKRMTPVWFMLASEQQA